MATDQQQPHAPEAQSWSGRRVVGRDGSKLGKLEHVYLTRGSDQPSWGVVKTGPLGRKRHFVPLADAAPGEKEVRVPVDRGHVTSAPAVPANRDLDPDTERRLSDHYTHRGEVTDRHARQHEEYGGFKLGAAFFGWLVALGMTAILTALLSAAGAAIGLTELSTQETRSSAGTIGIVGAAVLLAILFLAYLCGGYVAGRMSRFDGARQGLGVWLIGLLITIVLAVLGVVFGSEYNVVQELGVQPRIPVDEGSFTTGGIIALVAFVIATLGGAIVGGKLGERFHRKVDRV
jgi:hypothetical protein